MASATARSRTLPPRAPDDLIARPRLDKRLHDVLSKPVTLLVAGAGFGKSTVAASWARSVASAWYSVDARDATLEAFLNGLAAAANLSEETARVLTGPAGPDAHDVARLDAFAAALAVAAEQAGSEMLLVLDDVHEIPEGTPSARLVELLCRHAGGALHVVLSGRVDPPVALSRLRGRGRIVEIDAAALAMTVEEVDAVLALALDDASEPLAAELHAATGGWPAAVRMAVETLRDARPAERLGAIASLARPEGPLLAYLAEEVIAQEPPAARELIRRTARMDRFTPELCEAAGIEGAAGTIAALLRRGPFIERHADGWFGLQGAVRDYALLNLPMSGDEHAEQARSVAGWYERNGSAARALEIACDAGLRTEAAALLRAHGSAIVASGSVDAVATAAEMLAGGPGVDGDVDLIAGDARKVRGDFEGALRHYDRVTGDDGLVVAAAWRIGRIHYLRGDIDASLEAYERGSGRPPGPDASPAEHRDAALLAAWHATSLYLRGEAVRCRALATDALTHAKTCADDEALAAAHTVSGMVAALDGDRAANERHYLEALAAAERAGDVLQIIRVRSNLGSARNAEGRYAEALEQLEPAIALAEVTGYPSFLAIALNNRGEAKTMLGRLDEALADFEAAKSVYQRIGSRLVCYPLAGLGHVYRLRGDLTLARSAYEEAIARAQPDRNMQALIPSLSGLARVLAFDEPEEAAALAGEAVRSAQGMAPVAALLAAGWVALARGDAAEAAASAARANDAARGRRDRAGIAESLELAACAIGDGEPTARAAKLEEAWAIWRELEAVARAAIVELALAATPSEAARARATIDGLGVRPGARSTASLLRYAPSASEPAVAVQALGGFRVLRHGQPVPVAEWQSKKARDLLKILLSRRGRPVPRETLVDLLWPDEPADKAARRLSVALVTVRSILDPGKSGFADLALPAGEDSLALDFAHVPVDAGAFLSAAADALERARRGDASGLAAAEAMYTGDFLEDDVYAEWAVPLREEARAAYIAVARALAKHAAAAGDHDTAALMLLRILERDPFDEDAHLRLVGTTVAAGRHGEARRYFRHYLQKMEELGVEPAPFPTAAP